MNSCYAIFYLHKCHTPSISPPLWNHHQIMNQSMFYDNIREFIWQKHKCYCIAIKRGFTYQRWFYSKKSDWIHEFMNLWSYFLYFLENKSRYCITKYNFMQISIDWSIDHRYAAIINITHPYDFTEYTKDSDLNTFKLT